LEASFDGFPYFQSFPENSVNDLKFLSERRSWLLQSWGVNEANFEACTGGGSLEVGSIKAYKARILQREES